MSMVEQQCAFFDDARKLIDWVRADLGWLVTSGEFWRPVEMQQIYVRTGRSKTMNSRHLQRMAMDLNFFDKAGNPIVNFGDLAKVGMKWESMNPKNRWGGNFKNFKDTPHYERVPE